MMIINRDMESVFDEVYDQLLILKLHQDQFPLHTLSKCK
jgi:hypothetical protein